MVVYLKLYMDDREPKSIFVELRKAGLDVERLRLDVGDYIVGKVVIERKTSGDFCQSLYNNRIFKQIKNLEDGFPEGTPVLIVIGDLPEKHRWQRFGKKSVQVRLSEGERDGRELAMLSGIATIITSYGRVQIINLPLKRQFPRLIQRIYARQNTKNKKGLKPVKMKKSNDPKEVKRDMLTMLPGIGARGAQVIAQQGYSLMQIGRMSPEKIAEIFPRIGLKRAKLIRQVLNLKK